MTLNLLLGWAKKKNCITAHPGIDARMPRYDQSVQERPNEAFPIDVRQTLLEAAEAVPMTSAALNLLMFSGLRIGDMPALQQWHIDFAEGIIQIRKAATPVTINDETSKRVGYETLVATTKPVVGLRKIKLPSHAPSELATDGESL